MNDNYGWQLPHRALAFVTVFLLGVFSSFSAPDSAKVGERYLLKGNRPVHISLETGWKRQGLTPVQLDIQGLNLTLWMDGEGQVFDEAMSASQGAEKTASRGQALFRLDIMNGQMQAATQTLTGEIYEQNPLRTRLRFSGLNAALDLDVPGRRAALDLNGLLIPVRLHLGPNANGVRELKMGDLGNRGEGHLYLDARQGRLLWEDTRPGMVKEQTGRVCWAEKQR
jgi:hypothetical protein